MRRVLVTGGAGFIGSHLAEALVRRGDGVAILDDFSSGKKSNLGPWAKDARVVEGSVCDGRAVRDAMAGAEAVFHQAAIPSVERSFADPVATERSIAYGTLQVLLAAREVGARRVVFASSSSVYGDSPTLPKREDMEPNPLSPYAASKWLSERYAELFAPLHGTEAVALRYFNVYGPRQDPNSPYSAVIPRFVRAALSGEAPVVYGDGRQTRDFTFVGDVVAANLAAAEAPLRGFSLLNVCSGVRTSLLDLIAAIGRVAGKAPPPRFEPARDGDVRDSVGDPSRAAALLGTLPKTPLQEGLRAVAEWMRAGGN